MSRFPHVAGRITARQIGTSAVRRSLLGPGETRITNRILLRASTTGIYLGGSDVTTTNGAEIPSGGTAGWLELWALNPQDLYAVGSVGTVYIVLEEPEGDQ